MNRPPNKNHPADIPTLMEPVSDAAPDAPRALGRRDQQSLFDELPAPATPPPRRSSTEAARTAALHLLRARAPAIIDEVVAEQSGRLTTALRERLRRELDVLLGTLDNNTNNNTPDDRQPPL